MESSGVTHNGTVRSINQDVFKSLIDKENGIAILVVCDGMGGANAGNVASELAAEIFVNYTNERIKNCFTLDNIADVVADAVTAANTAVFDKGLYNKEYSGMGTTLTALVSSNEGEVVANIGDSRAYHITPNGITQITKDHSVVEDMIDRGEITSKEAHKHPRRNLITRAIGVNPYEETDIFTQNIDIGDYVLLCTDGFSNVVKESVVLDVLRNCDNVHEACEILLGKALCSGAPDNVTVAIFRK